MRHDKLERELNLLLLLTENHNFTVKDICDRMGISRRNLYYYLEFFRLAGFKVENNKPFYRIRKDSPFFRKLDETVHFTEDEAITLRRIFDKTGDDSAQVQRLKHKLDKLYDLDILDNVELKEQQAHITRQLYDAIKGRQTVMLVGYSSPHSNTVSDRMVEPFLFMNGNREIRCYEVKSKMNKTFKLSRMQDVQLLDLLWSHEREHRQMFTDVFMFSGEQWLPIVLRMGRLSASVLREEYPQTERYMEPDGDNHWLLHMNVCSYVGIGRFVLGLYEDIEVLESNDFRDYLRQKVENMSKDRQQQLITH